MTRASKQRRRLLREAEHGPERVIVATASGAHLLSCGHRVPVRGDDHPGVPRRRCARCLDAGRAVA